MTDNYTDAAVLTKTGTPLSLQRLKIPSPGEGQVVVNIAWTALCHSQLNEIRGRKGPDPYLPHTLGHEGSGIVVAIGEKVSKVSPGDPVVLTWIAGSGFEAGPTAYAGPNGRVNSGPISTFLRTAVISENRLVKIDRDMPLREAALLGCAVPTGVGMVHHNAKIRMGQSIAIFGVGGIGLAALSGAVIAEAAVIIALDRSKRKLERAYHLGATHIINVDDEQPIAAIRKITGTGGVDAAIEATGTTVAMEMAFDAVHSGGITVIAGNPPDGARMSLNPMDLIAGKQLIGSYGGGCQPEKESAKFQHLFKCGALPLADMITHEYPIKMINQAFDDLEHGKVGRALINMAKDAKFKSFDCA